MNALLGIQDDHGNKKIDGVIRCSNNVRVLVGVNQINTIVVIDGASNGSILHASEIMRDRLPSLLDIFF
jgi:hypothetical protein